MTRTPKIDVEIIDIPQIECGDCGSSHSEENWDGDDDYTGMPVCIDCQEGYFWCYSCEALHPQDNEMYSEITNESYCGDCYSDEFTECYDCSEELHRDDVHHNNNDDSVCSDCYDYGMSEDEPTFEVTDDTSRLSCGVSSVVNLHISNSVEDNFPSYENVSMKRYSEQESFDVIKSYRWIGVELECLYTSSSGELERRIINSLSNTLSIEVLKELEKKTIDNIWEFSNIKVVSDGSLNSGDSNYRTGEVVVNPRRGDYFIRDLNIILEAIKSEDGCVNHSCGTHMHLDARDLDWHHRLVLAGFVKLLEPHLYSFLAPSRRTNHYCKKVSQRWDNFISVTDRDSFVNFWYDTETFTNDRWNDKRYYGLNYHPSFWTEGPGSLELRYHSGTLSPEKLKHWAILWTSIVDKTKEIADSVYKDSSGRFASSGYEATRDNTKRLFPWTTEYGGHSQQKQLDILSVWKIVALDNDMPFEERVYERESTMTDDEIVEYLTLELQLTQREIVMFEELVINADVDEYQRRDRFQDFVIKVMRMNPIIDIHNLFEVLEIPEETKTFYSNRLLERLSSVDTPESHYVRCFEGHRGVVSFNSDKLRFELIDSEIERLNWEQNYFAIDFTQLGINHMSYNVLGNIGDVSPEESESIGEQIKIVSFSDTPGKYLSDITSNDE